MVHPFDITRMEDLLRQFQLLCTSGLSPLETLNQLYGSFPEKITGEVKCLGGSASGLKLYSAKIVLTDGPYFAATDLAQEKAVEKAATQAFNYLTEEAAKVPVIVAEAQFQPEQQQIKSLVDRNEVDDDANITEEELTHLQTVLEGLGYQISVKNSSSDTTVSNCLQIAYTCELDIPGLGKFAAESSASHTVATRKAGVKLKQFCVQFLGLEDPVIPPQNTPHFEPQQHFEAQQQAPPPKAPSSPQPPSPAASPNDFQPTSNDRINNQQIVPYYPGNSSKDEQLVKILNRFNEVYSPKKNPVSIMNEVLQTTGNYFSIETSKVDSKLSKTVIKMSGLAIFTARHPDPKQCRKDALMKFCEPLRSLARLFIVFRQVDTEWKTPLEILDELVRNCGDILKVSSFKMPRPAKKHQTTIAVNYLQSFVGTYTTHIGSRRNAAGELNAYLRKMKPLIVDSPQMDYSLKRAPLAHSQAHLYNDQESVSHQQQEKPQQPSLAVALLHAEDSSRASSPGLRQSTMSPEPPAAPLDYRMHLFPRDNRVIDFLSLFKTVNDLSQPPMVIINELLTRDYKSFKIEHHQKDASTYLTQVQVVDFGLFFGVASRELDSRKRALTHLYETLVEVVQFLDSFTAVYSSTKAPEEYLPLLFAEHTKLVQVQSWPNGNQCHFVIVINYLHHFNESSPSEKVSRRQAYGKMTQFLYKLTEQLNSKCPKRAYRAPVSGKAPPPPGIGGKTQEDDWKVVPTVSSSAIVETASVSGPPMQAVRLPMPPEVSLKGNQQLVPVKPSSKTSGKGKLPKFSPYVTASGADTETAARQFAAKHRDKIELINLFNSAYDPSKIPFDLMVELISGNETLFRLNTVQFPTCWKTALFLPTIHQQFTAEGSTESEALQGTYKQVFRWLNNLSYLFATFRKVYTSSLPGSEIIRPLLKDDLVTVTTELNTATGGMLSTVSLDAFSANFTCTGRYDYDSQNGAYTQAVAFFIAISDKIFDSSAQANIEYIETDEEVLG